MESTDIREALEAAEEMEQIHDLVLQLDAQLGADICDTYSRLECTL